MRKENRLTRREDFRKVYRFGSTKFGRYLVLHFLPIEENELKIGISVSKKVGNAIVRNRVKRRIREIVRLNLGNLPVQHFVVIGAKVKSKDASYQQLEKDFKRLLEA